MGNAQNGGAIDRDLADSNPHAVRGPTTDHSLADSDPSLAATITANRPGKPNVFGLIKERELGPSFGFRSKAYVFQKPRYLPARGSQRADHLLARYNARIFCGQFSSDGSMFMTASQDRRVRLYDDQWRLRKQIVAREVGWSVLDVEHSPDRRFVAYSGWADSVYLCNVHGEAEMHDALLINPDPGHFCLFSVKFSPDSNEIIGGSCDDSLYVYDLNRRQLSLRLRGHHNDVNTVTYLDPLSNQLIVSGSDDCLVKVWDRRLMDSSSNASSAVGVMVGHLQGITHVSSRNDGRYFISQGKDQCVKLWDLRKMSSSTEGDKYSSHSYDYRYGALRTSRRTPTRHAKDGALMTYRGHDVSRTLIRAYFSPERTTAQRYIYSGSGDGTVYIYDVISGEVVREIHGHSDIVRDLSWHPELPMLVSTSWDGNIFGWEIAALDDSSARPKRMRVQEPEVVDDGEANDDDADRDAEQEDDDDDQGYVDDFEPEDDDAEEAEHDEGAAGEEDADMDVAPDWQHQLQQLLNAYIEAHQGERSASNDESS